MEEYVRSVVQRVIAKICQSTGFDSITNSSLDFMTDLMDQYIREIVNRTHKYSEHCK